MPDAVVFPFAEAIGFVAAALTTVSFVPQVWLTWRTRDTRGVSLAMYAVFTTGIALWLAYGWFLRSWPMIIANVITLLLAASILAMKLRNRARDRLPR